MKYSFIIIGLIISFNLSGQNLTRKESKYIPRNLNESLIQLDKLIPDSTKIKIQSMTEDDFIKQTHFTTGLWIRNYWLYNRYLFGLIVTQSDLRKELTAKGLYSNDDMSGVILRSYYRKLNGIDINLEKQIMRNHQFYVYKSNYYVDPNNPNWITKKDSAERAEYMIQFKIGDTLTNHVYYDRNWFGNPRKDAILLAKIIEKSERELKIELISFGDGINEKSYIYEEIKCDSTNCWINPHLWRKLKD